MLDFLTGDIVELQPARLVLDHGGLGYAVQISQQTYRKLLNEKKAKVYTVLHIVDREGEIRLYGFTSPAERSMYRLLTRVNGVGASIAMAILSSMPPSDLAAAVFAENTRLLTSIKGVGAKTAGRIVMELKDSLKKVELDLKGEPRTAGADARQDAILALQGLGYTRQQAEHAVEQAAKDSQGPLDLETLIRLALRPA